MSPTRTRIYRVLVCVDVEATSPREAAHNAMLTLRGPKSPKTFKVAEKRRVDGEYIEIDLTKE